MTFGLVPWWHVLSGLWVWGMDGQLHRVVDDARIRSLAGQTLVISLLLRLAYLAGVVGTWGVLGSGPIALLTGVLVGFWAEYEVHRWWNARGQRRALADQPGTLAGQIQLQLQTENTVERGI